MNTKSKTYTYFIGIDVSKRELDFALMQGNQFLFHKEINNESNAIQALLEELKGLPKFTMSKALFCLEHTGFYGNHLLRCLKQYKTNVVVENAVQIQKSMGILRGKSDKLDSVRICQYAYIFKENLRMWVPKRPIIQLLATLFNLRQRLIEMQMAIKTPLQEQELFMKQVIHKRTKKLCKKTTSAIEVDLQQLNAELEEVVSSDPSLKHLISLITSVPGVGMVTALYIAITTNEFRDIDCPKKFASYCGVAPFPRESGTTITRSRTSSIANKKMKSLIHICAMSCISHAGELRDYYKRKTLIDGKPKMAVLNAVRYKLLLRVFACVNQNRFYEKSFTSSKPVAAI